MLHGQQLGARDEDGHGDVVGAARAPDAEDLALGLGVGVADAHPQQEAVELRLRQRIGPLELDRVLGGDDQERLLQRERLPLQRDL